MSQRSGQFVRVGLFIAFEAQLALGCACGVTAHRGPPLSIATEERSESWVGDAKRVEMSSPLPSTAPVGESPGLLEQRSSPTLTVEGSQPVPSGCLAEGPCTEVELKYKRGPGGIVEGVPF
jgi:hypothetical protein